jgi:hypothetical protein
MLFVVNEATRLFDDGQDIISPSSNNVMEKE